MNDVGAYVELEKFVDALILLAQQDPMALLVILLILMVFTNMMNNLTKLPGAVRSAIKRRRNPQPEVNDQQEQFLRAINKISDAIGTMANILAKSEANNETLATGIAELKTVVANNTLSAEKQFNSLTQQSEMAQAFAVKQGISLSAIQSEQTVLATGSATIQKGVASVDQKIDGLGSDIKRVETKVNNNAATLKTTHDEIMKRLAALPSEVAAQIAPELKTWQTIGDKIDELHTLLEKATVDLLAAIDRAAAKKPAPDAPPAPDPLATPPPDPDATKDKV